MFHALGVRGATEISESKTWPSVMRRTLFNSLIVRDSHCSRGCCISTLLGLNEPEIRRFFYLFLFPVYSASLAFRSSPSFFTNAKRCICADIFFEHRTRRFCTFHFLFSSPPHEKGEQGPCENKILK